MSLATPPSDAFQRSGKTPPPAPSAAYAKRAREIQEESLVGRYRPPALRGLSTGATHIATAADTIQSAISGPVVDDLASPLPPPSHPPGFKRARAGTLPSNVQLAAQHFASTSVDDLGNSTLSSAIDPPVVARPTLRHSASVASAASPSSRIRSGSLTLPSAAGLSNAFGSSVFSSNWLSGSSGLNALDELRSITSTDSIIDEYDVHTLDYLGLDDAPFRSPPPATVTELRSQAQAAIAGSLLNQPARLRASTVSNPYRRRGNMPTLLATSATDIQEAVEEKDISNEDEYVSSPIDPNAVNRSHLEPYDAALSPLYPSNLIAKGFKQSSHLSSTAAARPRAISVGNIDDSARLASGRRATMTDTPPGLTRKPSATDLSKGPKTAGLMPTSGLPSPSVNSIPASILRKVSSEALHSVAAGNASNGSVQSPLRLNPPYIRFSNSPVQDSSVSTAPHLNTYLNLPTRDSRSVSPSRENAQGQIPSRSLWIGNLDPSMTGEALAHVFAPYGAIESFRLLPEKECGFVNFVDMADAINAKEDVLGRLGGMIGMANGQPVRIGFGKADSAPPLTPLTAGGNQTSSPVAGGGPVPAAHTQPSVLGGNSVFSPLSAVGGLESQLQSSPTRALWIGSIPATTTPATILSIFSPFGPIESARVLTHKNCGFINFERLDDAVRARKALNGRDVLGSDVGAIRIGFARVPTKNAGGETPVIDETTPLAVHGVGDLSVGATIHALRSIKGASSIPADQQVLGGSVENYRSNLLLSMIGNGHHQASLSPVGEEAGKGPSKQLISEQQMIMRELAAGSQDAEADIAALADFRPPVMYYTSIPLVSDRANNNRRWDAHKLRELRKRIDSGSCTVEEIDLVTADFLDGEIVDLASDWLGNTVVQKLFEKCSPGPRLAMLERIAPHLAMIGIHKNGTWAAQKIIDCANTPEEISLIIEHLRPYTAPLLLDQFGNYVVQCCLKFGPGLNDFIIDAMIDRLWEVAQGRFGARSMRAVLESPHVSTSQQRRIATAIVLNSIPLATNPNGALLLTWLLDNSGFHSRYSLLAPRFTPHLSHLCTHKLASLTVLRIVNQKIEPEASIQLVNALFFSAGDHVLTDVLGDQVNGVSVVHKILTSSFIDQAQKMAFSEATKRVLVDLKVASTQTYKRLMEEVGVPASSFPAASFAPSGKKGTPGTSQAGFGNPDQASLAAMLATMQLQGQNLPPPVGLPPSLQINPNYVPPPSLPSASGSMQHQGTTNGFTSAGTPFSPFALRSEIPKNTLRRGVNPQTPQPTSSTMSPLSLYAGVGSGAAVSGGASNANQAGNVVPASFSPGSVHPQLYQQYIFELYRQQNAGAFHV